MEGANKQESHWENGELEGIFSDFSAVAATSQNNNFLMATNSGAHYFHRLKLFIHPAAQGQVKIN